MTVLGGLDDATALLDVLNEIEEKVIANRDSVSEMCRNAEKLGGAHAPPFDKTDLQAEVAIEEAKLKMSLKRLDTSIQYLGDTHHLLLQYCCMEIIHVLTLHQRHSRDLQNWQTRVNEIRSECAELEGTTLDIDRRLAKALSEIQSELSI